MSDSLWSTMLSCCALWPYHEPNPTGRIRLPSGVDSEVKVEVVQATKRRALLVGISYKGKHNTWQPLDGPHSDVDRFRDLLIGTYGYLSEDITVLKDDLALPGLLQPTRENMIRELKRLVSDASSGDKFTFLYSGHSDQQPAGGDPDEEEDGQDEVIITSDEQRIIDNELKQILVMPLPVDCSLLAILDTCHSGTMLDLPHHHCNNVYVPWQSKGERRTQTMLNKNVRGGAYGVVVGCNDQLVHPPPSISSVMSPRHFTDPAVAFPTLRIDTKLGEASSMDQRALSAGAHPRRRARERTPFLSPLQCDSPVSRMPCDGWCKPEPYLFPTVVSLSACSDLQRAWEGPRGSLTTVLCNYLQTLPYPSYHELMSHINFRLHDNARALHEYTRFEKKKKARGLGLGFDGEIDNFQAPELSSLAKLNMKDSLQL